MIGFSVVIPVYNIKEYISVCLDSIIIQHYEKLQIILIDDGSTDGSSMICDDYANRDKRITVIHKKNGGVVSARLEGIRQATMDYIVCIDGDDWIEQDYFSSLSNCISQSMPEIICCGYKKNGETNSANPMPYPSKVYNRDEMEKIILPSIICDVEGKIFPQHLWAKAFRNTSKNTELFNIDERIYMGEDSAIIIPMIIQANSLAVIDDTKYCYRYNPNSLTKKNKPLSWDNIRIWYRSIASKVDLSQFDFRSQVNRYGALSVFYIATSQFDGEKNYLTICEVISKELEEEIVSEFIKSATFNRRSKQWPKIVIIRHKLFFLLKMFYLISYKNRK